MNEQKALDKPPIDPVFRQAAPNASIDLGTVNVSIANKDGGTESFIASSAMTFGPNRSVELTVPLRAEDEGELWAGLSAPVESVVFDDSGKTIDVIQKHRTLENVVLIPRLSPVQIKPSTDTIKRATFHLFNWPDFWGRESFALNFGGPGREGVRSCGRVTLNAGSWSIEVCELEESNENFASLKKLGGDAITHVGAITRDDSSEFSTDELEDLLNCLRNFFSFALGRWSPPSFCVGFDASNRRVYERWGIGQSDRDSWIGGSSWFDRHNSHLLSDVFPGFWRLWKKDLWQKPLANAVYWYCGANQSNVGRDTAILQTQAALELLAWTYCTQDRKMVSEKAFSQRGLVAADKLRLLVSSLDIPVGIPSTLKGLLSRRGQPWSDSMHAITDIRNGLVHPGSIKDVSNKAYLDAWRLSMWFIELVILRLCGHRGKYSNRLDERWVGTVESVPWASDEPSTSH